MKGTVILLVVWFVLVSIVACGPLTGAGATQDNDYNLYANTGIYGDDIKNAPREVIDSGNQKIVIIDLKDGWKLVLTEQAFAANNFYYNLYPGGIYAAWQHIASQADIDDVKQIVGDEYVSALLVKTKRKGGS